MKRIFTLLFSFLAMTSFAQNEMKELKARLVDEEKKPVQFANISLKMADNDSIIAGTSSDENGNFILNVEDGKYILMTSAIGYERLSIYCRPADLGELKMPRTSEMLDAVTIEGSRIEETPQHYVILPDPTEVESSGRGLNFLNMQQLPGLDVNVAKETITIDGGTPVYQINGKEVSYQRFINVSSDKIKRIEYSNNPGVRYMDRGASGVINIVLKEVEDGGSIVANGKTAFTTGFADGYVMGTYNRGKSEIMLQYNISHRNYDDVPYEMTDKYINENRMVERKQSMNFPFYYTTHNIMADYTYRANDSTFMTI
ncbi:MAG: carboxypeptidase-like regulatory domain-containing protein, partial [Lentimicrobiaceae bacterium]|nr:carboxypeptidase-like regulatory domain-containing protein [Lentimicrobiaceae bacterium]